MPYDRDVAEKHQRSQRYEDEMAERRKAERPFRLNWGLYIAVVAVVIAASLFVANMVTPSAPLVATTSEVAMQPMSTAPFDGTIVRGFVSGSDAPIEMRYLEGTWIQVFTDQTDNQNPPPTIIQPTGWLPKR